VHVDCLCILVMFCAYAGSAFEVKIEPSIIDVIDDKLRPDLCTVCDKRFTTKSDLNVHSKRHTAEYLYLCSQCDTRFQTQESLHQHMNSHTHTSKFKCTECGKCFRDGNRLAIHRRRHSGERPFECTVCDKRFTTKSDLNAHSKTLYRIPLFM